MRVHYERHRVRSIPKMYMPHAPSTSPYKYICSRYAGPGEIRETEEAFICEFQRNKSLQDIYSKSRM